MEDETDQIEKAGPAGRSRVFNLSVRSLLSILIVGTACALSAVGREIREPLYSSLLIVLGAMFGQQLNRKP